MVLLHFFYLYPTSIYYSILVKIDRKKMAFWFGLLQFAVLWRDDEENVLVRTLNDSNKQQCKKNKKCCNITPLFSSSLSIYWMKSIIENGNKR